MSGNFADLVGQVVVVDTDGPVFFIGRLAAAGPEFLSLEDVDVRHQGDTPTSRERYIIEARRLGVRPSRKRAEVRLERVVGLSRLEDVIEF
jgi:hypothetical protein